MQLKVAKLNVNCDLLSLFLFKTLTSAFCSTFICRLKGVEDTGRFCIFSHSLMCILAQMKDMCSIWVPLSSTHSISVPTLALLPPEMGRAK